MCTVCVDHTHTQTHIAAESLTVCASLQITTAGTTVTRRAVATPAQARSSSATVAAASLTTGPAMATMIAATTATRPMPTAPIRVRTLTLPPRSHETVLNHPINIKPRLYFYTQKC